MKQFAVLMMCHDRVAATMECLKRLFAAVTHLEGWLSKVFLVDDGGTDGTGGRVRAEFPEIHVIDGDGSLYWAKGMCTAWCDVLVLPTLSENFGLVIAEALERGKRVITTDGSPAWGDGNDYGGRLVYLKGYRDGTDMERCMLLANSIMRCLPPH